ncbi:hypothetical protein PR048_009649 [Dryococelus australis]|uniref:Uncharacterized protein n=1 Tax=Dryococelus australis TaxID=614101 RepID=A0ABQ9I0H9_9NEOP|nr:hypothetical protein PR048_009649 [Dryococelus australis]
MGLCGKAERKGTRREYEKWYVIELLMMIKYSRSVVCSRINVVMCSGVTPRHSKRFPDKGPLEKSGRNWVNVQRCFPIHLPSFCEVLWIKLQQSQCVHGKPKLEECDVGSPAIRTTAVCGVSDSQLSKERSPNVLRASCSAPWAVDDFNFSRKAWSDGEWCRIMFSDESWFCITASRSSESNVQVSSSGWDGEVRGVEKCFSAPGLDFKWGRGDLVVRLLAFHQGAPGTIPGGVATGFSHVGIVPGDAARRRVFSGVSRFLPPLHSVADPHLPRPTLIGSQDLDVKSRPILFACLLIGDSTHTCRRALWGNFLAPNAGTQMYARQGRETPGLSPPRRPDKPLTNCSPAEKVERQEGVEQGNDAHGTRLAWAPRMGRWSFGNEINSLQASGRRGHARGRHLAGALAGGARQRMAQPSPPSDPLGMLADSTAAVDRELFPALDYRRDSNVELGSNWIGNEIGKKMTKLPKQFESQRTVRQAVVRSPRRSTRLRATSAVISHTSARRNLHQGRVISRNKDIAWPPKSPHLTACDFFLWGHLKTKVFRVNPPKTIVVLKQRILYEVALIPVYMLREVMQNFVTRLGECSSCTRQQINVTCLPYAGTQLASQGLITYLPAGNTAIREPFIARSYQSDTRFPVQWLPGICTRESCRAMPVVTEFSRGYPVPPCISALLHTHLSLQPLRLSTPPMLRATQTSRLITHSQDTLPIRKRKLLVYPWSIEIYHVRTSIREILVSLLMILPVSSRRSSQFHLEDRPSFILVILPVSSRRSSQFHLEDRPSFILVILPVSSRRSSQFHLEDRPSFILMILPVSSRRSSQFPSSSFHRGFFNTYADMSTLFGWKFDRNLSLAAEARKITTSTENRMVPIMHLRSAGFVKVNVSTAAGRRLGTRVPSFYLTAARHGPVCSRAARQRPGSIRADIKTFALYTNSRNVRMVNYCDNIYGTDPAFAHETVKCVGTSPTLYSNVARHSYICRLPCGIISAQCIGYMFQLRSRKFTKLTTFPYHCERPLPSIASRINEPAVTDVCGIDDSTATLARACIPPLLSLPRLTALRHARTSPGYTTSPPSLASRVRLPADSPGIFACGKIRRTLWTSFLRVFPNSTTGAVRHYTISISLFRLDSTEMKRNVGIPSANKRLANYLPSVARPIGNFSQHAVANQTQGPFTETREANQRTGTPTSTKSPCYSVSVYSLAMVTPNFFKALLKFYCHNISPPGANNA